MIVTRGICARRSLHCTMVHRRSILRALLPHIPLMYFCVHACSISHESVDLTNPRRSGLWKAKCPYALILLVATLGISAGLILACSIELPIPERIGRTQDRMNRSRGTDAPNPLMVGLQGVQTGSRKVDVSASVWIRCLSASHSLQSRSLSSV